MSIQWNPETSAQQVPIPGSSSAMARPKGQIVYFQVTVTCTITEDIIYINNIPSSAFNGLPKSPLQGLAQADGCVKSWELSHQGLCKT